MQDTAARCNINLELGKEGVVDEKLCNMLQHAATRCNAYCDALQHTATETWNSARRILYV